MGEQTVEIKLTDCTANMSKLSITVKGEGDSTGGDTVFKNTEDSSDAATGVGIEVFDTDGSAFKTDGSTAAHEQTKVSDGYDIKYKAKYISTSDAVKSGKVKSTISVTFDYS
ncbi:hypothetical protein TN98_02895 [Pantoea anthophila]|nr:hypothetical protein TN98_02895 [Pantoea anthophila]